MNLSDMTAIERLHAILNAQCERGLDEVELAELQSLVTNDARIRRTYLQSVLVHARLKEDYAKRTASIGREQASSGDAATLDTRQKQQSVVAGPARSVQFNYQLVASRLAVAASFYGVFTLLTWSLLSGLHRPVPHTTEYAGNPNSSEKSAVATLVTSNGAKWKVGHEMQAQARLFTDRYELESGAVEIQFDGGATISLQAPAVVDLRSKGDCYLSRGALAAVVPEQARGFAVQTPTARIVDLGTEFGVVANGPVSTHVEVFTGEVLISSPQRQSSLTSPTRLAAGDVRTIDEVGQIAMANPSPEGFRGVGGRRKFARNATKANSQTSDGTIQLDESIWRVRTDLPVQHAAVSMESGLIRLANRGYLISRQEYRPSPERPLRVRGKFYWDGPEDSFQLATRSSGVPGDGAAELADALEFGFWPTFPQFTGVLVRGDRLRIEDVKRDEHLEAIPGMVLAFEVVDRGDQVQFSIWQESLPSNRSVFTARVTQDSTEKQHVVLHNRERTDFENVLYVDRLQIEQAEPSAVPGEASSSKADVNQPQSIITFPTSFAS